YVIHTVGPVWSGGNRGEDELLRSAYLSSLSLAKERGVRSLSFPSISTGVYGFPMHRAARIALKTVRDFISANTGFDEVRFVLFGEHALNEFLSAWEEINAVTG
ncbi:MAG: putative phosphatase-like proteinou, partial [Pelotomaculum thermopropionicum]